MLTRSSIASRAARRVAVVCLALTLVVAWCNVLNAQMFSNVRSVGGISIDANGVLRNATLDELGQLSRLRTEILRGTPDEFNATVELRKVSLRRLEDAIEKCMTSGDKLPAEIELLAGLQQIRYIFVYPEQRDIVLAGPGEGWTTDKRGNVVGVTTGRPVMYLDDLLVALRTARQAADGGITCSIDPTPEGLARLQSLRPPAGSNPYQVGAAMEKLLGPQQISFTGVPPTSHFARVLIAADYRMKCLGMGLLEDSPLSELLPSYMSMMRAGRAASISMPRWWLEPNYQPLLRSPDGLSWELRGGSVKAMTEEEFLSAAGNKQRATRPNPVAQRWADNMTEKYDQLAVADPIFGELRNCMELAVVGALVVKERLTDRAGYSMPILLDPADLKAAEMPAPKQIDSVASVMKKGSSWVISASGGVSLNSWFVADEVRQSEAPATVRAKTLIKEDTNWWWN